MKKSDGKKTQYAKASKTKALEIKEARPKDYGRSPQPTAGPATVEVAPPSLKEAEYTAADDKLEQPVKRPKGFNKWTVMVYLAGDNNLAEEMVFALKCMKLVGSSPPQPGTRNRDCQVFAYYDGGISPATLKIDDRGEPQVGVQGGEDLFKDAENAREDEAQKESTDAARALQTSGRRLEIAREEIAKALKESAGIAGTGLRLLRHHLEAQFEDIKERAERTAEAAEEGKQVLAGFVESVQQDLFDFVVDTIADHPAEHYLLVLSGHGSGAVGDFLTGNSRPAGLSIPDLKEALIAIQDHFQNQSYEASDDTRFYLPNGKIDILGLDSCVMGMAEVAFEVRDCVRYLIGAEGYEPNAGWPYDRILNVIRKSPTMEPGTLAKRIVGEYNDYYLSDYTLADVSTDLAALDLNRIEALARGLGRTRGLSSIIKDALKDPKVQEAMKGDLKERLEYLLKDDAAKESVRVALEEHLLDPETPGSLWKTLAQDQSLDAGIRKALKAVFSDAAMQAEISNSCGGGLADVPLEIVMGPETRIEVARAFGEEFQEEIRTILRESRGSIKFDDKLIRDALKSAVAKLRREASDKGTMSKDAEDFFAEVLRDDADNQERITKAVGGGQEFVGMLRDALERATDEVLQDVTMWDPGLSTILADCLRENPLGIDKRICDLVQDAVVLAHWKAQGYKSEQHVDVWDFCDLLKRRMEEILVSHQSVGDQDSRRISNVCRQIIRTCQEIQVAIEGSDGVDPLVLAAAQSGAAFQHSRGISIFFPWSEVSDASGFTVMDHYKSALEFAEKTHWDEFVIKYHKLTQRELREGSGDQHPSALNRLPGLLTSTPGNYVSPLTVILAKELSGKFALEIGNRLGTALNARLGTALNARLGTALNARLGTALNARLGTALNARLGTALNARLGTALNARLGTELNRGLGTELNARMEAELGTRLGTALNARLGTALNARLGTALNARLGTALNARLGTALNARNGSVFGVRLGTALNARLGTALNARLGTALNARLGTALNARLGTALNARLTDGGGGVEKIAAMKNPATKWFERRAGQKKNIAAGTKG